MFVQGFSLRYLILVVGLVITSICSLVYVPINIQLILFLVILLVTGIPHGSLDLYLEERRYFVNNVKFNRIWFIGKYIFDILSYTVFWFFFPNISLLIFICITAYHFGEIDWIRKNNSILNSILFSFHGLLLILFIIVIHIKDTATIIYVLVKKDFTLQQIITIGNSLTLYCCVGAVFLLAFVFILKRSINWKPSEAIFFLVQTLLLYSIITALPFYLSFMFYFGIWHSVLSFDIIRKQLNFVNNVDSWKRIINKSLPFVFIAIFTIVGFSFSSFSFSFSNTFIKNIIIGISVLTLPHLQVFSKATKLVSR